MQLCKLISSKRIELMTSIWAHFKELRLLFKMSPSWGHLLDSFRKYELTKLGVSDPYIFCFFFIFLQLPMLQFQCPWVSEGFLLFFGNIGKERAPGGDTKAIFCAFHERYSLCSNCPGSGGTKFLRREYLQWLIWFQNHKLCVCRIVSREIFKKWHGNSCSDDDNDGSQRKEDVKRGQRC